MRMPACPCNVADAVDGNWMLVTGSLDVKIVEDAICYDHIPSYGTSRGRVYIFLFTYFIHYNLLSVLWVFVLCSFSCFFLVIDFHSSLACISTIISIK